MDWPGSASKVLRSENPQKLPSLIPRNSTDVLMIQDHREVPGKERNKTRVVASSEVAGNAVENRVGFSGFRRRSNRRLRLESATSKGRGRETRGWRVGLWLSLDRRWSGLAGKAGSGRGLRAGPPAFREIPDFFLIF